MRYSIIILLSAVALAAKSSAEAPKRKVDTAAVKPLTYANVVSFFKEANLHLTRGVEAVTIFFEC